MVDVKKIEGLLITYFYIQGTYKIDPDTGVIDVQGEVQLIKQTSQLPVQFGHVSGYFACNNNQLTNLSGSPSHVGGAFYCLNNKLTSLSGSPVHVDLDFNCYYNKLTSLSGSPLHVGGDFAITYASKLPLLRLCGYNRVTIFDGPEVVLSIMEKYTHTGKPGALKAAAELIRAGYAENAKW